METLPPRWSAWNASDRTRRSQTQGSATNESECNTRSIVYNAPLAHQEPSIFSSFRTSPTVQMTERHYQLTVPVYRELRSWDFRVPVSLECKFRQFVVEVRGALTGPLNFPLGY